MFRVISTPSATLVSSSPDVKLGSLTLMRHKMTLSHFSKGLIRPVSGGQFCWRGACGCNRSLPSGASEVFRRSTECASVPREGSTPVRRADKLGRGLYSKNLYIPLCTVLGGEILVSSRLGPRMESAMNMNGKAHDNMTAPSRQNDGDDGCSKCTGTPPILLL